MKKVLNIRFNLDGTLTLFGEGVDIKHFETVSSCINHLHAIDADVPLNNITTQLS